MTSTDRDPYSIQIKISSPPLSHLPHFPDPAICFRLCYSCQFGPVEYKFNRSTSRAPSVSLSSSISAPSAASLSAPSFPTSPLWPLYPLEGYAWPSRDLELVKMVERGAHNDEWFCDCLPFPLSRHMLRYVFRCESFVRLGKCLKGQNSGFPGRTRSRAKGSCIVFSVFLSSNFTTTHLCSARNRFIRGNTLLLMLWNF